MLLTWPSSASLGIPSMPPPLCTSWARGEPTLYAWEMLLPPPASVASQKYSLPSSPLPHPGIQPGVFLAQLRTWFSFPCWCNSISSSQGAVEHLRSAQSCCPPWPTLLKKLFAFPQVCLQLTASHLQGLNSHLHLNQPLFGQDLRLIL